MNKKMGIMVIGINGAIGTTISAGIEAIKKFDQEPIGLVTELDEFKSLDLCDLNSVVVGGWDIIAKPHLDCMRHHGVVDERLIERLEKENYKVDVFNAPKVGITQHILEVDGVNKQDNVLTIKQAIEQITKDIETFKESNQLDRVVVVNLSSTEPIVKDTSIIESLDNFEKAIDNNDSNIQAGMVYAYAAIKAKVPFVNFTPSATVGTPALKELAMKEQVAVCGNDGKTGQTLYKTVFAPMLKWRHLKLLGWYSTNILGNNDGRVLENPSHKETKIRSKSKVLSDILGYDDFYHRVEINYYPPRGDAKEAWDNIDFEGWLGSKMQMKIDWIGEDSILAAPLVVDLARLIDYTQEKGNYGVAKHLSSFFKDPIDNNDHNFFNQINLLLDYIK